MIASIYASAQISACDRFRYDLVRVFDAGAYMLPIIMLNPSTASERTDDPTIRRCMAFARRETFGGIKVANLHAYRATKPVDLGKAREEGINTRGMYPSNQNDDYLHELFEYAQCRNIPVLCAWGASKFATPDVIEPVQNEARRTGVKTVCLGLTGGGNPRHPLYVAADQPFEPYVINPVMDPLL